MDGITKDQYQFCKKIGRIGVGTDRHKSIPMELLSSDGSVRSSKEDVMNEWHAHFESLLNLQIDLDPPEDLEYHNQKST